MQTFFQKKFNSIVKSPNGTPVWWHSLPMPNGDRIDGANPDKDHQFKMWNGLGIANEGGLAGKSVLDIGANDGFFSIAAFKAGARAVTSVDMDWSTWPKNIQYGSELWDVKPEVVTADFRKHDFGERFDVIFFFGVLYHLEDVFTCMKTLGNLLEDGGAIYMETQMTAIQNDLPIFEYASDIYPTTAGQGKTTIGMVGISNYLFPNMAAMRNLAHSYDFDFEVLDGDNNVYSKESPTRQLFKLTKKLA